MKYKLLRLIIIAALITLSTEYIESKFNFNLGASLLLSIPAFILGLLIERWYNRREFERKISGFILSLVEIRKKDKVEPEAIQKIMCKVTNEFADILDQTNKIKGEESASSASTVKFNCLICDMIHQTDSGMNCKHCGLSSEKWTYLNNLLTIAEKES